MNNTVVLKIRVLPYFDATDVSSNDGTMPDAAPFSYYNIANNASCWRNKNIQMNFWVFSIKLVK
jgi:hypothetical protein